MNRRYKVAFVRAFTRRVLGWVDPVEGGGCPHACAVDFDAPDATDKLACMHLDHERPRSAHHMRAVGGGSAPPDAPHARVWDVCGRVSGGYQVDER